jgi:hypothetical protein
MPTPFSIDEFQRFLEKLQEKLMNSKDMTALYDSIEFLHMIVKNRPHLEVTSEELKIYQRLIISLTAVCILLQESTISSPGLNSRGNQTTKLTNSIKAKVNELDVRLDKDIMALEIVMFDGMFY